MCSSVASPSRRSRVPRPSPRVSARRFIREKCTHPHIRARHGSRARPSRSHPPTRRSSARVVSSFTVSPSPARHRARIERTRRRARGSFGDTAGAAVVFSPDVRVTTGANDLILGAHDGETPVRIEPSEICGLVGANGAGKSTLVKCLSGRRDVSDGTPGGAGAAVGVLEQTAVSGSTMTVEEEAMSRMTHVMAAREAMEEATEAMAAGRGRGATVGGRARGVRRRGWCHGEETSVDGVEGVRI